MIMMCLFHNDVFVPQNIELLNSSEPEIKSLTTFLEKNGSVIRAGLKYLEEFCESGFDDALAKVGFALEVVPDDEWNEYKDDPTETSEEEHTVRVKESYFHDNLGFCDFQDRYGWAFHELVHAVIFSGNMPAEFMGIDSPFRYPMNTDEIYAFGFQLKNIYRTRKYQCLMDYYVDRPGHEEFPEIFNVLLKRINS